MAEQLVTLESPDGRRYRTDSPSEVNLLVGSYGYQRVDASEPPGRTERKRSTSKQSSNPAPASSDSSPTSSSADEAPSS